MPRWLAVLFTVGLEVAENVLRLGQAGRPAIGDGEVLLRVHEAGLDRGIWHLMAGLPYPVHLAGYGIRAPKTPVRGREVAGRVEAVGGNVTALAMGEEVFGIAEGSLAENARARSSAGRQAAARPSGARRSGARPTPRARRISRLPPQPPDPRVMDVCLLPFRFPAIHPFAKYRVRSKSSAVDSERPSGSGRSLMPSRGTRQSEQASAAAMDSRTATAPMRLALAIDGCAPVSRAARSHESQARDPVANGSGPRFSPISNAKGCPRVRAARALR